jgi:hypothetical protein
MSTLACRFCDHRNPDRSQFCNACGSPLSLKPCAQCQAVNNADATTCYQCGVPFALEQPVAIAVAVEEEATQEATTTNLVERPRTPELFAQSMDALAELEKLVASTRRSPRLPEAAIPLVPDTHAGFDAGEQRRRWRDVALALTLLVAVQALVYFAYRPPESIDDRLGAIQRDVAMAARASVPGTTSPTTTPGAPMPPPNAHASSEDDSRNAATATPTEPAVERADPAAESEAVPSIEGAVDESLSGSQPEVGAQQAAPSTDEAAQPSEPPPMPASRATARPRATTSTTSRPKPPDTRSYVPPLAVPRLERPASEIAAPIDRPCTEAVAALGLCDPTIGPAK